jgi:hypothetical protein
VERFRVNLSTESKWQVWPELHCIVRIMKACSIEAYDKIGRDACPLHAGFLLFQPDNGKYVLSKRRSIFVGIRGVISQRTEL